MTLTLRIDAENWRTHQHDLANQVPGLVPVAKGNGYGFGLELLAKQATKLGVETLAVGIVEEVEAVRSGGWQGDVVVLNPWRPGDEVATALLGDEKVITTVSRVADLAEVSNWQPRARVIVEIETSMRRHGIAPDALSQVELRDLRCEGWTIHLPATGSLDEANRLAAAGLAVAQAPIWVSHLWVADYRSFNAAQPVDTRMRIGTRLWLGAHGIPGSRQRARRSPGLKGRPVRLPPDQSTKRRLGAGHQRRHRQRCRAGCAHDATVAAAAAGHHIHRAARRDGSGAESFRGGGQQATVRRAAAHALINDLRPRQRSRRSSWRRSPGYGAHDHRELRPDQVGLTDNRIPA